MHTSTSLKRGNRALLRLTYDEALVQAAKHVAQDNHLPQVQVQRQVGQNPTQERQIAIVMLIIAITFHRQSSHLQNKIQNRF